VGNEILRSLWKEDSGVLSMQVPQEFYVSATRKISSPFRDLHAGQSIAGILIGNPFVA
jgi:hypothetical protein